MRPLPLPPTSSPAFQILHPAPHPHQRTLTLPSSPFQVFSTVFCRARAYENDTCHGLALWFMALRFRVDSISDWPPDRNMMPGTAGGTRRRSMRSV